MSNNIEKFWDSVSGTYKFKQWEKDNISRFDFVLTKNAMIKFLKPSKKDSILEIGCGPGKWTNILSEKCKKIVSVDISKKMIYEAKKYCKCRKNISFIHGDIMELNFDEKFDKIISVRSLEYIKNKKALLNKAMSLLNKKGKIIIITKTTPCLWDLTKKVNQFWQSKISHRSLVKLCREIGFKNIVVKPVIIRLPIFVSGNREFPIVGKWLEPRALNVFKKITEASQNIGAELMSMPLFISESYLLYAEK